MSDKPVVGFIGLGHDGLRHGGTHPGGGFPLWVRGRRTGNRWRIWSPGRAGGGSLAEMASACDIIHICVSNSAQVEGPGARPRAGCCPPPVRD